jgi:hypothetical protein
VSIIAYDAGLADGKDEVKTEVVDMIQKMLVDPPQRGDIALAALRRAILEKWS